VRVGYVPAAVVFEFDDGGVAELSRVVEGVVEVDVGGFLSAFVVLLGVFDDAGGAEGHEALLWVGGGVLSVQKLVRNYVAW
jgi:hypothetical protein